MASLNFEKTREILTNHIFETSDVRKDLLCKICKNIMIDSHVTYCGCHYCGNCIKEYIQGKQICCPGSKDKCSENYLVMYTNLSRDVITSYKIENLIVKCPYNSCSVRSKLENMKEHVNICSMRPFRCPYETVGCVDEDIRRDNVNDHLNSDSQMHSQLLLDAVNNLRNDIVGLKQIIYIRELEIKDLKDDRGRNMKDIDTIREAYEMKKEMDGTENTAKRIMTEEIDGHQSEGGGYGFGEIKPANVSMIDIGDLKMTMKKYEMESMNMNRNIEEMKIRIRELTLNRMYDFNWTLKDYSAKNGWYNSDSFYKDNYKFCMQACINNNRNYLQLYAIIMQGKRDERVQWPMRDTITVSIVHQETLEAAKSWTQNYAKYGFKSVFHKPKNDDTSVYVADLPISEIGDLFFQDSLLLCFSLSFDESIVVKP